MAKRKVIITNNREIYEKLNMLNFSPEVVLKGVKELQINRILNNINSSSKILDSEILGDYILIKKIGPINYQVYLK